MTEKVKINLNIPIDVLELWDKEAQEKGITRTALIITAVSDYVKTSKLLRDTDLLNKMQEITNIANQLKENK